MVSIKDTNGEWYMGWSYKDGSPAELLEKGQTVEVIISEDKIENPDGTIKVFKNWKFPTKEDRDAATIEDSRTSTCREDVFRHWS